MSFRRSDDVKILSMGIACLIVMVGWLIAAALIAVFLGRRVERVEREHGPQPDKQEIRFLFYALSVFVGLGAIVCTILFLQDPKTVRRGRVCGLLGVAHISAIVALTCAGMFALAWYNPSILP